MTRRSSVLRQKTSPEEVAELSQFQPAVGYELHSVDLDTGQYRRFSPEREQQIERVLSGFIKPHVREVEWHEKPCGIDRFLDNAKEAIASFETTRAKEASFDRGAARALLLKATSEVEAAVTSLGAIQQWKELDDYLRQIFVDRWEISEPTQDFEGDPSEAIIRSLNITSKREGVFRSFSPVETKMQLMRLSTVIAMAADKIVFKPGDRQRDWIADQFADDMLFAWFSAAGQLPAAAKSNNTVVNRSPFINLLAVTNSLIEPRHRHPTGFRAYAIKVVDRRRRKESKI